VSATAQERLFATTRPDPALMKVYLVHGLGRAGALLGVLAFIALRFVDWKEIRALVASRPPATVLMIVAGLYVAAYAVVVTGLFVRYKTLRYHFDESGVGQSWGLFFRRETFVAYARIQDIQVQRSVFEKWFGLGTIEVQTASAGSGAEATLDGLREFDSVAEFLRERLRGRNAPPVAARSALALLGEIGAEVRALREAVLSRRRG
jgi:uncharacterized membrane protein YdbT with pleckstrin-like domain